MPVAFSVLNEVAVLIGICYDNATRANISRGIYADFKLRLDPLISVAAAVHVRTLKLGDSRCKNIM